MSKKNKHFLSCCFFYLDKNENSVTSLNNVFLVKSFLSNLFINATGNKMYQYFTAMPSQSLLNKQVVKKSLTSSINDNLWNDGNNKELRLEDFLVFLGLESLGTLAIAGNLCLITVLLRNKYLNRARLVFSLNFIIFIF